LTHKHIKVTINREKKGKDLREKEGWQRIDEAAFLDFTWKEKEKGKPATKPTQNLLYRN